MKEVTMNQLNMNQKIYRKELIDEFLQKIKSDDKDFIKLYLNQNSFKYPYRDGDIIDSDIPMVNNSLGDKLYDLQLEYEQDNRVADFECAKLLYETLAITPEQASNQQFWNYLHHGICYKYIHARWDKIKDPGKAGIHKYIERHWLMTRTSQKHLINAPLSTLWWSIHITIDASTTDKYELSQIYFGNNRYRTVSIGGSSFVRHKPAIHGILEYIKENDLEPTTELGGDIAKYINLLGGTKPLSFFEKDWFKKKIYEGFGKGDKYRSKTGSTPKKKRLSKKTKEEPKSKDIEKTIKYFNIRNNGEYNLSKRKDFSFDFSTAITDNLINGYILLCYNESGYINRVKISDLLNKTREVYQNGIYRDNTINTVLTIPREAIIGIIYYINGAKHFKAILSDQLKDDNSNVGLQGYKTMYSSYDRIEYVILPFEIKEDINKLIFKSLTASGKEFTAPYYKREFKIINSYLNNGDLTLF